MRDDTYRFRIDSFTPKTLPMARLAEYMGELAKLFGSAERVHFVALKPGSAVLVADVEAVAAPKVRDRLTHVDPRAIDDAVAEQFRLLNTMLVQDNAIGRLQRGTATILDFPGRTAPPQTIGPVTQRSTVQGQLVRIGGRDKTSHGLIEDVDGRFYKIVTTRDTARTLAQKLYGAPIRVTGQAKWFRDEVGQWSMEELRVESWEPAGEESLRESVERLRQAGAPEWFGGTDPVGALARIRNGDDEVH